MANSARHVVIIHGLGSKPPKEKLAQRYHKYLSEGVGVETPKDRLHLVYWADLMGYEPDGPARDEYKESAWNFKEYSLLEEIKFRGRGFVRSLAVEHIEKVIENYLLKPDDSSVKNIATELSGRALDIVSERIYSRFLPDLHRYFNEGKRALVKNRLSEGLNGVASDAKVCLIAHSMGSIIALDLICSGTRMIDLFVTIGSPLGIGVVQSQIGIDDEAKKGALPDKIGDWFNFFDRLDVVALDSDLEDDFPQIGPLDVRIKNEFINKDGDRNHHKSYGYLRAKELGSVVGPFLAG